MNHVELIGRLTRDVEIRFTKTGKCVSLFTLAVNTKFGDKEVTDFIPCVAWGNLAETAGNNLEKGNLAFVEGRMQVRSYEAKDGTKRYVTEVICNLIAKDIMSGTKKAAPMDKQGNTSFDEFGHEVEEEIPF